MRFPGVLVSKSSGDRLDHQKMLQGRNSIKKVPPRHSTHMNEFVYQNFSKNKKIQKIKFKIKNEPPLKTPNPEGYMRTLKSQKVVSNRSRTLISVQGVVEHSKV